MRIRPPRKRVTIKGHRLTDVHTVQGLGELRELQDELEGYWAVLLGHEPAPIDKGVHTLQEVATAYYARAKHMQALIRRAELDGDIPKGSNTYSFRTGELRFFTEACARAADLGSRRVTVAQLAAEMKLDAADLEDVQSRGDVFNGEEDEDG